MSILSDLAAETSTAIPDPTHGLEWRVRRVRPSGALKAGLGLPGIGSIQAPATDATEGPTALDMGAMADRVEYLERVAMAAVDGVRRAGAEQWERVTLVLPQQEDPDRLRLSVSVLSADVLAAVGSYALNGAQEAADAVGSFRAAE